MKKGIMAPFFTEISMKRRLDLIKEAGFSTFMMSLDKNHEKWTAPFEEIIEHCKKIGLKVECGHAGYKDPDVNEFWNFGYAGDKIEAEYLDALKIASKLGVKTVVFHMHFEDGFVLSQTGIERLKRLTKFAEEAGVRIAVENLYSYDELGYIFDNISSKNLGMCFDSGHENFLTPNADFLHKFGDRLMATHIHDNNGIKDEHKTPFTGSIDWHHVAEGYAKANSIPLEAEVRLYRPEGKNIITEEELLILLKREFQALSQLEKLVEIHKEKFHHSSKNKI